MQLLWWRTPHWLSNSHSNWHRASTYIFCCSADLKVLIIYFTSFFQQEFLHNKSIEKLSPILHQEPNELLQWSSEQLCKCLLLSFAKQSNKLKIPVNFTRALEPNFSSTYSRPTESVCSLFSSESSELWLFLSEPFCSRAAMRDNMWFHSLVRCVRIFKWQETVEWHC